MRGTSVMRAMRAARGRRWRDLPRGQRRAIQAAGMLQAALLATALADLVRRPAAEVRGRKWLWLPALFVNFVGPLAYLGFGRRPAAHAGAEGQAGPA